MLYVSCRNDGTIHPASRPTAASSCGSRAWASPPAWPSTRTRISSSVTAAAPSSKSARIGWSSSSPRSSPLSPRTTWPSAPDGELYVSGPTDFELRPYRPHQRPGRSQRSSIRGLGRPQRSGLSIATAISASLPRLGRPARHRAPHARRPRRAGAEPGQRSRRLGAAAHAPRRAHCTTTSALFSLDWDVEGLPLPR